VLSIILAVLLAALLLTPASPVGAVPDIKAMKERSPASASEPKHPKGPKPPEVGRSRHGGERIRSARTKPEDMKQDNTVTPNRGTIDPIGAVSRGQVVEINGTALRTGQTCLFRIFYADKPGPVIRDVVPDSKKRCTASVTIPDRPGVVGDATVVLVFQKAASGKRDGSARQAFTIN
jgi:hypothetical protein